MTEFFIPTNFEDSGKLMGIFNMRNVIEAGILSLPFVFFTFKLIPVSLLRHIRVHQKQYMLQA